MTADAARLRERIAALEDALLEARRRIAGELAVALECACLCDRAGRPRRETLDPLARGHVRLLEAALAKIDKLIPPEGRL